MLYWHFRQIQCILAALLKKPIKQNQPITKTFIANPFDSDWGNSIQAGRFFTYTDAARWEFGVRMGLFRYFWKKRIVIVMGSQKIIHRRPVKLFRKFQITMHLAGWDNQWFYFKHIFSQNQDVKTISYSKVGLRKDGKFFSPVLAFQDLGFPAESPDGAILKIFEDDKKLIT